MVKLLVLQSWYGLIDEEMECQSVDRISFRRFFGYPDKVPDSTAIWLFRERLAETEKDRLVCAELQCQLDSKGLKVRNGVLRMHHSSKQTQGSQTSRGERRRGLGGAGMVNGLRGAKGSVFGYKLHVKTDLDRGLIRDLEITGASVP